MKRLGVVGIALALSACGENEASRNVSLTALGDCGDVERVVRERLVTQMSAALDTQRELILKRTCVAGKPYPNYGYTEEDSSGVRYYATSAGAPAPAAEGGEPNKGASSYSTTNNQVVGVDEADLLKNDARYFYIVSNGALHVIDAFPPEQATVLAKLPIQGTPLKLFVEAGRAVVFSRATGGKASPSCTYGYDCQLTGEAGPIAVTFVDLAELTAPKVTRTLRLEGSLLAARRIGRQVFISMSFASVTPPKYTTRPNDTPSCADETTTPLINGAFEALRQANVKLIEETPLSSLLPVVRDESSGEDLWGQCGAFYAGTDLDGSQVTSVFSIDLSGDGAFSSSSIIGRPGAVYANGRSLYVAARVATRSPEQTAVHRFSIDGAAVSYAGSARVAGHVLNPFSMDEYEGHLRIATSVGRVPDPNVHSAVTVLDTTRGGLVQTGLVSGIAPTEDIRSVRFVGPRGYLVTFKKTDPLFSLDLSDPRAPRVTGELKIPGFSTYMHPVGADH
ncbi:MAG: beta-propeller domain-containing protein, partial [Myxococcaceae bacterium]|nr:beta-propeller domain-containing protein [Myxococcaceae bacterium]